MQVAIIKYGGGNIYSLCKALERSGAETILTDNPEEILKADKIVLPGQGNAACAMTSLVSLGLDGVIRQATQPVLGICVGMQLLCKSSEEGHTPCLGIIDTVVKAFNAHYPHQKVPAMGWNEVAIEQNPLFASWQETHNKASGYVYFIHSYYVPICKWTIAESRYILPYSAAVKKDNFYGVQFHPEKSGKTGELILQNFLSL